MQLLANAPQRVTQRSSADSRPSISAAIICYNEERWIGSCIESLSWCDEVVVVDSGSTDRTAEIVRSFSKARLVVRKFDTFKNQKNFAVDECRNDWILSLDADEVLPSQLRADIEDLQFDTAGYKIRRINFLADHQIRYGNWNPDYALRLFDRSQCRWGGTNPHESIVTSGKVKKLKSPFLHYSYETREEYIERSNKYASMMVEYLRENGRRSTQMTANLHFAGDFLKAFLLKRGFLDGADGLFLAWHGAKASYRKHSELAKPADI